MVIETMTKGGGNETRKFDTFLASGNYNLVVFVRFAWEPFWRVVQEFLVLLHG